MDLNATPSSERIHIGIFGKRNAGKSSLINAITGQNHSEYKLLLNHSEKVFQHKKSSLLSFQLIYLY